MSMVRTGTSRLAQISRKTVAFDGTAGNGALGTVALFTVTGRVLVHLMTAICTENVVGATATITFRTATTPANIVNLALATDFTTASPIMIPSTSAVGVAADLATASAAAFDNTPMVLSENLQLNIATAAVTDGTLVFYVVWEPLTVGASLA